MHILIFQFFSIILLAIYLSCANYQERIKKRIFFLLSFSSMWYVHSMVDANTFEDLPTYKEVFESICITPWNKVPTHWATINMELGYLYFNKIIGTIFPSFTFFLWIFSFWMLFFYFRTIKYHSPYVTLSILLLLLIPYNQSLFVIRQHMAVAIYFATIPLILKRKLFKFLLVALATFFLHRSSIMFIPVYFLFGFDGKRLIVALAAAVLLVLMEWGLIISLSASLFDYEWFTTEAEGLTNLTTFVQILLFYLIYVFSLKKAIFESNINKLVFCVLTLALFVNTISVGINIGRMGLYYNVFSILSIPISLKYIKSKYLRVVIGWTIVLLLYIQMSYGSNFQYVERMRLVSLF